MKKSNPHFLIMVLSGAHNLWDELILFAERQFLQKKFPSATFSVATYDERSLLQKHPNDTHIRFFPNNFKKFPGKNIKYFFENIREIWRSDVIIIGGGGIFFDNEPGISFRKNLFEWWLRIFFARLFWKKMVFWGISLEVKNPENQKKLQKIFRPSDTILVRDERSEKILKDLGLYPKKVVDSVFLLPPQSPPFPQKPFRVGISLRDGFLGKEQIRAMKNLVKFLCDQGHSLIFLSHSLHPDSSHNDAIFIQKTFGNVHHITQTIRETHRAYKNLDLVISMRLHASILAAQNGLPILMLSYGPKTEALADILWIRDFLLFTKDFEEEELFHKFFLLCNNYKNEQAKISALYREIHTKFLQNITKIDIV